MMTETISPPDSQAAESPRLARPETDAVALRAIEEATEHVRERALRIRANPEAHKPRLVLSQHARGTSILDRIADAVSMDMPGRQRHIQDCVDQILAKVDPQPAAG
jgi:hypothetical protein